MEMGGEDGGTTIGAVTADGSSTDANLKTNAGLSIEPPSVKLDSVTQSVSDGMNVPENAI